MQLQKSYKEPCASSVKGHPIPCAKAILVNMNQYKDLNYGEIVIKPLITSRVDQY